MGDSRFERPYRKLVEAKDRAVALRVLSDDEVISALAWVASGPSDPYIANILATEALNRLQRLRLGLEYLAEAVIATDAKGRIMMVNREAERKTGWRRDELVGHSLCEMLHARRPDGSSLPPEECRIRQVRDEGRTDFVEEGDVFLRKDGSSFPVAYAVAPVILGGEIRGTVLVFRDLTERALESRVLRAKEERLRRLTEASVEALVVHDGLNVLDINSAALRSLGYSREELLGMPVLELVAPTSREMVASAMADARELREELVCLRANGEEFRAEVAVKNIAYGEQQIQVVAIRER